MNIKEFEVVRNKPFDLTLKFELYEDSEYDKKSYKVISGSDLFAEAQMTKEVFSYNISNKTSMRKYLSLGMDRETIVYIIRRLMAAEAFFDAHGLNKKYLMYDADLVLVDKENEDVTFVTVPAVNHGLLAKPLRAFIKEILANAIYDEDENLDYVGRLLTYINSRKAIDMQELEKLLNEISAFADKVQQPEVNDVKPVLTLVKPAMETEKTEVEEVQEEVETQEQEDAIPEIAIPEIKIPEILISDEDDKEPEMMEAAEEVKMPENDKMALEIPEIELDKMTLEAPEVENIASTPVEEPIVEERPVEVVMPVVEEQEEIPAKHYPYLIRSKTQEIITIDKDEFKIGKIPGMAEYLLSDNPAVSRMHAIIHNVDGTYYICDNYSTNHTYLNGECLEPGKNYMLISGVKVSLANDEFTYLCEANN